MNKKFALISTYEKKGISQICRAFKKNNISIISTGKTAQHIIKLGYKCKTIDSFTKFKEILGGRVKTLNSKLHASLLFNRKNTSHISEFKKLNFPIISFVIVNLYPFKKFSKSKKIKDVIEMIDIGGPALLRSSAKNYEHVTVITKISDYEKFSKNLEKNNGETSLDFRFKMAQKVFKATSNYDNMISDWFKNKEIKKKNIGELSYGENPHQKGYFFSYKKNNLLTKLIKDQKISYNNILDIDSAISLLSEFREPTCAIIKHNNACGVSSAKNIKLAYKNAIKADPLSAYGGVIAINKPLNEEVASSIISKFFQILIVNGMSLKLKKKLGDKKKLIIIDIKNYPKIDKKEIKSINGGYLLQDKNVSKIKKSDIKLVSTKASSKKVFADLMFALKVCKHIKSNAIVIAKNKTTLGIGAGQMSRIGATKLALSKINEKNKGFVTASDAFFPFTDSLKILHKKKCIAVIQPQGSINDNKIINFANKHKISLYFSKIRYFRH